MSPLFPDIIQCMQIQVLEIKKSLSRLPVSMSTDVSGLPLYGQLRSLKA